VECPCCFHTLSSVSTATGDATYFLCEHCKWTSQSLGLVAPKAQSLLGARPRPWAARGARERLTRSDPRAAALKEMEAAAGETTGSVIFAGLQAGLKEEQKARQCGGGEVAVRVTAALAG
jgi:hypothetical protein